MRRRARSIAAAAALFSLWSLEAGAQRVFEEMSAMLVMPIVTSQSAPTLETRVTVTNGSATGVTLRLTFIPASDWNAVEATCLLTAFETTSLLAVATSPDTLEIEGECDSEGGLSTLLATGNEGVLVVTLTDGQGLTVGDSSLHGSASIVDVTNETTHTAEAVGFKNVDPLAPGLGDRAYAFDGSEFERFPDLWAMHFFAEEATSLLTGSFIFAALDGRSGDEPAVELDIQFYDDDAFAQSTSHTFKCFDIVPFTTVDAGLGRTLLGSESGHLTIEPVMVLQPEPKHDVVWGNGDGERKTPVVVWYLQELSGGGTLGGSTMTGDSSFGGQAEASRGTLLPGPGDTPVLDIMPIPEPAAALMLGEGSPISPSW